MKIGYRKPSLKKSFKASTTGKLKRELKRSVNPYYGKKGTGMITDPKKSVYNKVYKQTTVQTPAPRFGENEKATSKSIKNNSENEIKIDKANNEQESVPQKMDILGFGLFVPEQLLL